MYIELMILVSISTSIDINALPGDTLDLIICVILIKKGLLRIIL